MCMSGPKPCSASRLYEEARGDPNTAGFDVVGVPVLLVVLSLVYIYVVIFACDFGFSVSFFLRERECFRYEEGLADLQQRGWDSDVAMSAMREANGNSTAALEALEEEDR